MKGLSLLAGKAASSGGSVAGCTSSSQKVKNIIADTSVATAHSAASSSAGSESMTCTSSKGLIQNVEIPLKTIFLMCSSPLAFITLSSPKCTLARFFKSTFSCSVGCHVPGSYQLEMQRYHVMFVLISLWQRLVL
ncbi:hypothetical protein PAHAL_5G113700 [Panicum hallii]|uniref:Uncharacterized protein n=1 Tax=Panicum hallii TaxID=206008 RepID=A0A2T8IJT1_9POAL|nr:hypothetical protein PAHAL_5G113700 [Panicum hallii]